MRAVQLTAYGNPVEALKYVDIPAPEAPGPNQVLIGVEFSPINPSDLLLANGIYALRPALPTVIGNAASPGGSEWSFLQTAFSLCLVTRTRASCRCWRSIPRPRRCCSASMSI